MSSKPKSSPRKRKESPSPAARNAILQSETAFEEKQPSMFVENLTQQNETPCSNANHFHYEFGGPVGAFLTTVSLPFVVLGLYYSCTKDVCLDFETLSSWSSIQEYAQATQQLLPNSLDNLITPVALKIIVGWLLLHVLLERILPGEVVCGTLLPKESTIRKLSYVMSGHLQFWLTLVLLFHGIPEVTVDETDSHWVFSQFNKLIDFVLVYDHFAELIVVSTILSILLSLYLYYSSFLPNQVLATGGQSGNIFYDFFIGRYNFIKWFVYIFIMFT